MTLLKKDYCDRSSILIAYKISIQLEYRLSNKLACIFVIQTQMKQEWDLYNITSKPYAF